MKKLFIYFFLFIAFSSFGQSPSAVSAKFISKVDKIEPELIGWRRDFHQFPELSNRETKTGEKIAQLLTSFGIKVQSNVAKTGVVGILKGALPGPVVALRADMDALPLTERNGLPFASKQKSVFQGKETGVMHACGHDGHMAILLGVAKILSESKNNLKGTIKFIFQPAEEGPPEGEKGGAALMIEEGVMENPKVDAVFGLHIQSLLPVGTLSTKPEGLMASSDGLSIKVKGLGAHGATPWDSVDPIVVGSQIVLGLQTILSRQINLTIAPATITVGQFNAGVRNNIIPEEAILYGTIRTLDPEMQKQIHEKIKLTATRIAESAGATAEVTIDIGYPVTYNNANLTAKMIPSLQSVVGVENFKIIPPVMMSEDFSYFQKKAPGLFFFLGAYPADMKLERPPTHHTPDFIVDEKCLPIGVKALLALTVDYMEMNSKK